MKYMIVETFKPGCKVAIYERLAARGRLLPDGLSYLDSWVEQDGQRCFQLMETEDATLLDLWIESWSDLVEFEIVPVVTSDQANER